MGVDLRLALRLLRRDRAFTLTAISALTLGLAANILVFTLVNGLLLRDLPFAEPDRLVAIRSHETANNRDWSLSYPDVRQNEQEESPFDPVAYLPYAGYPQPHAMLLARSELSVATVADTMREELRRLDAELPLFELASLDDAVAAGQIVQSIMGGVGGSDPATLTAVPALLVLVAFVACLIPARRAMRVNPVEALRAE